MSTTLIIILIIAALLVLWGISVQNKLVQADELCNHALKQINAQQVSRYDALQALSRAPIFIIFLLIEQNYTFFM